MKDSLLLLYRGKTSINAILFFTLNCLDAAAKFFYHKNYLPYAIEMGTIDNCVIWLWICDFWDHKFIDLGPKIY
jgi:hypothetical protein